MRSQDLAILLSSAALLSVVALALFGPDSEPVRAPEIERTSEAPVESPLLSLNADGESAPRLGGPSEQLAEEVRRLRNRVHTLEAELEALREQHEKIAAAIDPVRDVLEFLQAEKPKILRARRGAQQTAAIATLRNVASAQAQTQATACVDEDRDGTGEFAGFREMSGAVAGRMSDVLIPPVLSSAFRTLSPHGEAQRNGYLYRFYLPGPRGRGVGESEAGFDAGSGIDPDLAETTWCCYAWPAEPGASRLTFFMNQAGDVLATEADYAGPGGGPAPDAAFVRSGAITGKTATEQRGSDGNVWRGGW